MGGRFLIRLEDTDQARSSESSARGILEDLAWLGIAWDEGPELGTRHQASGTSGGGEGTRHQAQGTSGEGKEEARVIGGDPRGVGPWEQSKRLAVYNEWIDRLIERDLAYPAFDTPEELDVERKAAAAEKRTFLYRRGAAYDRAAMLERMRSGEPCVIRFRPDDAEVIVPDIVLGDVRSAPGEVEDFIIRKRDGFPTYHFAVVVDDAAMGVTHILRGQEHLSNTPKHVQLQRAMGVPTPVYAHMPLIFNDAGAKMSKRERDKVAREAVKARSITAPPEGTVDPAVFAAWLGDTKQQLDSDALSRLALALGIELPEVSVEDFRGAGYLPEVITNYIALLGWTPSKHDDGTDREKFDMGFLAKDFALERIGKTNAKFDRVKLRSFNGDAIGAMSDAEFAARWRVWCDRYQPATVDALGARWEAAARAARPRCRTLADGATVLAFLVTPDDAVEIDPAAAQKHLLKGEAGARGIDVLALMHPVLAAVDPWDASTIDAAVSGWAEAQGVKMGVVAQALRVAITGTGVSPGIGETLGLVGRKGTLARVARCVKAQAT
jgi:glutamyl-tRNA synthetase